MSLGEGNACLIIGEGGWSCGGGMCLPPPQMLFIFTWPGE